MPSYPLSIPCFIVVITQLQMGATANIALLERLLTTFRADVEANNTKIQEQLEKIQEQLEIIERNKEQNQAKERDNYDILLEFTRRHMNEIEQLELQGIPLPSSVIPLVDEVRARNRQQAVEIVEDIMEDPAPSSSGIQQEQKEDRQLVVQQPHKRLWFQRTSRVQSIARTSVSPPQEWSVDQVHTWLSSLTLNKRYDELWAKLQFNGECLIMLKSAHLRDFGVSKKDSKKITKELKKLNN